MGGADWVAVIPVKRLGDAKSRLRGGVAATHHAPLALALVRDTVAAVRACPEVTQVLLVTDEPELAASAGAPEIRTVPDRPAAGLNAAARFGADVCAGLGKWRAVLTGDLPALRPAELAEALRAAGAGAPRRYVADAAGTGTVLLTAGPGAALEPRFGAGSASAHARSGAQPLTGGWPGLRRDVDTAADLRAALRLGTGPHTRAVACEIGLISACPAR